jgi:hypothetical protein
VIVPLQINDPCQQSIELSEAAGVNVVIAVSAAKKVLRHLILVKTLSPNQNLLRVVMCQRLSQ